MQIAGKPELQEFWELQPDAEGPLKAWIREVKNAEWGMPPHVKEKYGTASILKYSRVVFNIKGGRYRLVTKINYEARLVRVRWVGTHNQYDKINAEII